MICKKTRAEQIDKEQQSWLVYLLGCLFGRVLKNNHVLLGGQFLIFVTFAASLVEKELILDYFGPNACPSGSTLNSQHNSVKGPWRPNNGSWWALAGLDRPLSGFDYGTKKPHSPSWTFLG